MGASANVENLGLSHPLHVYCQQDNCVCGSNPALTGNFPVVEHLPTPVHPAVMGTWNFQGCKFNGHGC